MSAPREVAPLPSQDGPAVRDDSSTIREEPNGLNSVDWSRQLLEGRLPQPRRERWRPLRAGLLNIYLFQDERFPFADGRLLLRGVNATGKSRVLAFLLPFLLEGDLRSTRFEPDRDSTRQVGWNLLMGEHHDRLGYTWLELGRCDSVEGPQFLTLGCGLRAVEDRGIVDHWFFITTQRVDQDLRLVTPQETALTQRQLSEALADKGEIFERATDYQRAVDDKLFRLGDRFAPLIDLLLQLRQPQLAKKLDLEHLESALRESLPPVSGGLMANAAEAFRSLDADRQQLQASRDSLAHTQSFLAHYRQHVRIGLRRAADGIRSANSSYESASRRLRDNVRQLEDLEIAQRRQVAEGAAIETQIEALDARIHALEQSDDARAANRLDDKRRMVDDDKATVERFERAYDQSQQQLNQRHNSIADGERHVAASLESLPSAVSAASVIAAPAELATEHQRRLDGLAGRPGLTSPEVRQAVDVLRKETRRWRTLAEQLSAAEAAIAEQRTRWRDARRSLEDRERDHDNATIRVIDQSSVVDATRASSWTDIVRWHGATTELRRDLFDLPAIEISWMKWAEEAVGASPLTNVVDEALRRLFATIATDEAETMHRRAMLQQQQRELQDQLAELRAGVELCPPAPPTRDPMARQTRSGAPLWRMIDFAESVPTSERAGWEAALEASGLLDAWVEPDGRLRDADRKDTILDVSDSQDLPFERQLSRVLAPAGDFSESGVARETIDAMLRRIGVGTDAGRVWVDKTGRWRNGALTGCWQKEDSQYIGVTARERHRRRKIEEIELAVNAGRIEDDSLSGRLEELSARRNRLNAEQRDLPGESPLREALAHWREVERQAAIADLRRREAAELEQREQSGLNSLVSRRDQDASDMGLADWSDRASELLATLGRYEQELRILEQLFQTLTLELERLNQGRLEHQQAAGAYDEARRNLESSRQTARQREVELQTLLETCGAAAKEIIARLADSRGELSKERERQKFSQEQLAEVGEQLAVLRNQRQQHAEEMSRQDRTRREAVEFLQARVERGLLKVAALGLDSPEIPWSMTDGIDLARLIERESQTVKHDDDAWQRSQTRVHTEREELRSRLAARDITPEPEFLADGMQLVHVPFRGAIVRIDQLAEQLEEEVNAHERVLSEKERRVFEDFLLGEVGSELHRRLHEAGELVEMMNREVARRPMSTGMQMRFRLELTDDASPELRAARGVMIRMQETWSTEERESLIHFLQRRIQAERINNDVGSHYEQLRAALDYRRWHVLRIERRSGPDQPWRLLTRRTYGPGSGGEKAIALTLPQLAAAAAYYRSAHPHAPRFILLDEAFAGVSSDNRGSCMELLVSFDLDVVMTSENERGCYPSVPALAICRLSRAPDLAAVLNEVFIWNGKRQLGPAIMLPADASAANAATHANGQGAAEVVSAADSVKRAGGENGT